MEQRIQKLEESAVEARAELRSIDVRLTRIEVILPTLATKADLEALKVLLHKTAFDTQKWLIATIIGMFLGFGGMLIGMSNSLKPIIQVTPTIIVPQTLPQP